MLDPSANSSNTHLNFPNSFDDNQDSGVCSPPLWRTSPRHRSLSPASRAQAIARGQRELMEMVGKMPESSYELSLKDLVEVNTNTNTNTNESEESKVFDELPLITNKPNRVVKKTNSHKWSEKNRTGSTNNSGFLLKMVFPVSLGPKKRSKKKKKKDDDDSSVTSKGSLVSPRPSIYDGSVRSGDKDWWKKEFSGSQGSDSGISSMNSGSTKSTGSSRSSSNRSRSSSRSSSNRSRSSSIRENSSGCLSFLWKLHIRE